ncbi:MAG: septum formation initiator family protein [Deltaproteobacteria bacterium]|nr:septum formation initiator family protein [Deltaproteobacteria bacterium]
MSVQKVFIAVICVVAVLFLVAIFLGNRGILDNYYLTEKLSSKELEAKKLENTVAKKREELHLLKTDPRYIEMIARAEHNLVKPGEKVFFINCTPSNDK